MMPPTMVPSLRRISNSSRSTTFELEEHAVRHCEQRITRFHEEHAAEIAPGRRARHGDLGHRVAPYPDVAGADAKFCRELIGRHRPRSVAGRLARLAAEHGATAIKRR